MGKSKDRRYNVTCDGQEFRNKRIKYGHGWIKVYLDDGLRFISNLPYTARSIPETPEEEAPEKD